MCRRWYRAAMTRVVLHEDDVGFSWGANEAFAELSRHGTIGAGSVMVPTPWFHDLAERVAGDPSLDVGVHLTLTSEHPGYRWAPMSRPSRAAGLTDPDGFMWPSVSEVRTHADPDAVEAEWRLQVDAALAAGIDVTHLDAHMGAALAPEWCDRYVALGVEYGVPALLTTRADGYGPINHLTGLTDDVFGEFVRQARDAGMPVFDRVLETDFGRARGAPVDYRAMFDEVDADDSCGLVYAALHPCRPGEVERIDPATWHVRTDEYELFSTAVWRGWLDDQPFERIGMRELRDEWRVAA